MSGDTPVCYYWANIETFMQPNATWNWVEMLPDLSLGKVTDPIKAGLLSFKLSIHDKSASGPIKFDDFPAWKKPPPKRLNLKKIRAYIFQCRDLPSADNDGSSDPYIKLWDTTKEIKQTKVIMDNNNPLFYETIEILIETSTVEDLPPFIFDIWDKDALSSDFICRSVIHIKDANFSDEDNADKIPEPKWHICRLKPKAPKSGEILVSFSVAESDFNFKTPFKYVSLRDEVDFKESEVEINILGLRDLQSVGILPVKKAFV
jgi:hypothetical protein